MFFFFFSFLTHLQHEFIKNAQLCTILQEIIKEAREILTAQTSATTNGDESVSNTLPFHP